MSQKLEDSHEKTSDFDQEVEDLFDASPEHSQNMHPSDILQIDNQNEIYEIEDVTASVSCPSSKQDFIESFKAKGLMAYSELTDVKRKVQLKDVEPTQSKLTIS